MRPEGRARAGVRVALATGTALLAGVCLLDLAISFWRGSRVLDLGPVHLPARRLQLELCVLSLAAISTAALAGWRGRGFRVAAVMSVTFAALTANTRTIASGDTLPTALMPFVILRGGSFTFGKTDWRHPLFPLQDAALPYYLVRVGGQLASKYPPATALLATPVYLLSALGPFDVRDPAVSDLQKFAAALLTALGVGCVFIVTRRLVDERTALLATALYVLGTPVLPVLGQGLWQHTGAAVGFSVALLGLSEPRTRPWLQGLCVGLGTSVAVACRPVDAVLALSFAVALFVARPRAIPWMVLAAVPAIALTLLYQLEVFGSAFATGYGRAASAGWTARWADGFPGLLFSPGRGLLTLSPILLLALLPLGSGRWRSAVRRWFPVLLLGALAFTVLMAKWWSWDGGFAPGNRMLSDTMPILGVGLALGLNVALGSPVLKRWTVAAAVLSVVTMCLMTYVFPSACTKDEVWNLRSGPWSARSYPLVAYTAGRGEERIAASGMRECVR